MKYIASLVLVLAMLMFGEGCGRPVPTLYPNDSVVSVWVLGNEWRLTFGKHDDILDMLRAYALTDCAHKSINIHNNLTYMNQRNTIFHELLHAATCDEAGQVHNYYFNSTDEDSHGGFYKIADFTTTLLHDNPELAKYLTN